MNYPTKKKNTYSELEEPVDLARKALQSALNCPRMPLLLRKLSLKTMKNDGVVETLGSRGGEKLIFFLLTHEYHLGLNNNLP